MPNIDDIKMLIARMPELDPEPPPEEKKPEKPKEKPGDARVTAAEKPKVDPPKAADPPKPKRAPGAEKGKLTGPKWEEAQAVYDAIFAGGKETVSVVIDLITENDIGPAYKPRYVLHGMAVYACREGKEKERAAMIAAILPEITGNKPKTTRAFLVRTLQACADPAVIGALAPLLGDEELADPAAAAMVELATISEGPKTGEASQIFRDAMGKSNGRARLAIIQALGSLKDRASIETLAQAAWDKDENVQVTALWALARTGDAGAIDPILKAADAPEGWLRRQATKAAFMLAESFAAEKQKENAGKIYRYLQQTRKGDEEKFVREAAERGLEGMK